MSKYTPGPWTAFQREGEVATNYWRIRLDQSSAIGDSLAGYCGAANARLIRAAPELAEALQAVMHEYNKASSPGNFVLQLQKHLEKIGAALAKAGILDA